LIAIIVAAIVWSYFGEIDTYIKASGIVRPAEKVSTIQNKGMGRLETVNIEEGQKVYKGDILYTIEQKTLQLQKETYNEQLEKLNKEVTYLEKYKDSIQTNANLFNKTNGGEGTYYNLYTKYETDQKATIKQMNEQDFEIIQTSKEAGIVLQSSQSKLDKQNETKQMLLLLKQSLLNKQNMFDISQAEYYSKYSNFELKYTIYMKNIELAKQNAEQAKVLYANGALSRSAFEDSENQLKSAIIEQEQYVNEYLLSIETNLEQTTQNILELELAIQKSQNTVDTYNGKSTNLQTILQKQEIDTIVTIEETIKNKEKSIENVEIELKNIKLSIDEAVITAPIDGTINMLQDINVGDLLQAGSQIATIVPFTEDMYTMQLYVYNKDIANIKTGQKIKYNFSALPYQEYGSLEGTIQKIGTDAKSDSKGLSYYIIEATIENKPIYSYKGKQSEIKVGMTCEAQVITESKKILNWLLEKIDLID